MNPLEYLITGLLFVLSVSTWALFIAVRTAPDGFETEHGFQLGVAPQPYSLLRSYSPAAPARATVPEIVAPRRPPGSKPPMLPVDLKVADLNPSTVRRTPQKQDGGETTAPFGETTAPFGETTAPFVPENRAPAPGSTDTPSKS